MARTIEDDGGRSWKVEREAEDTLVFTREDERREVETDRAGELDDLPEDELLAILDESSSTSRSRPRDPAGPGESPVALGRETMPHADPSDFADEP